MSSNSNSAGTTTLGAHVNFYDSQEDQFDLDREPKDPTQPTHDTDEAEDDEDDIPSIAEMLDRTRGCHSYAQGVSWESWLAGTILRSYDNPPLFCPSCFYQFEEQNELTDPEHHLPLVEVNHDFDTDEPFEPSIDIQKHDHRRHRHCPDCGVVTFGGKLGERDIETFVDIVKWALDEFDVTRARRREEILDAARKRKSENDQSDTSNMERIVREVRFNLDAETPQ